MSRGNEEDSVLQRATRAFGWSFGSVVTSRLGTIAIGVAMTRVLGPDQFGIVAIATLTLLAILSFNELGVSLAIIRWRDAPETIAPTINTISVASSLLLTGAVILAAPWISEMLGDARATPVVQVLAVSILSNGMVATPAAILQREFMQKQRAIADQVNIWLGAGLSLLFVLLGWGAMSLAIGRLIANLVFAVMLFRWCPVPYRFGWDRDIARRLLRFGLPLAASSIVVFASGYTEQLIIGSTLGAQALGFYVLAFNLASWPVSVFSAPLRAVAPAAFSALKHDPARMSRNFTRVLAVLSCVAVPACLAISGAAEPVVSVVYGVQWLPAAEVLLWMAACAALRIWFELSYDYLVVQGNSGIVLIIQICSFVVSLPLMLVAVRHLGAPGVAAVQFFVALVVVTPLYLVSLHHADVRMHTIGSAVALPVVAGALVWLGSWLIAGGIDLSFFAATLAATLATCVIALLAIWQRSNLRLLRAAATGMG